MVYKFYETEIGLAPLYAAIATIIYSVWNAVNDPLIGYLTNKGAPFSARLGRRFPWILLGLIITAVTFILIFFVPQSLIDQVRTRTAASVPLDGHHHLYLRHLSTLFGS